MTQPRKTETKTVLGKQLKLFTEPEFVAGQEKLKYRVLKSHIVKLTHGYAQKYLDLTPFSGERDLQQSNVQKIYNAMYSGNFNEHQVVIAFCKFEGKFYKINGQHTCTALLYMPEDYSLEVKEVRYAVDSMEQLRLLYSVFDRLLVRSNSHITKVQLTDAPELEGVSPNVFEKVLPGLKLWLYEGTKERAQVTPEQYAVLIRFHHLAAFKAVVKLYQTHNANESAKRIRRAPVYAAMLETISRLPRKANEFWGPVADGLTLSEETDARYRLHHILRNVSLHSTYKGSTRDVMDQESLYRLCVAYWNKWRDNEPVKKLLKVPEERIKAR
jgi:hypothetical protein